MLAVTVVQKTEMTVWNGADDEGTQEASMAIALLAETSFDVADETVAVDCSDLFGGQTGAFVMNECLNGVVKREALATEVAEAQAIVEVATLVIVVVESSVTVEAESSAIVEDAAWVTAAADVTASVTEVATAAEFEFDHH